MKKRVTEEQIARILRDAEIPGIQIREVYRKHNVTEQTFFRWRNKDGVLAVADTRRLKTIESENARAGVRVLSVLEHSMIVCGVGQLTN